MESSVLFGLLSSFITALLVVTFIHPQVMKFAKKRNIVDNPDARKLQRNPVPVMGGVAVFFGLVAGLCVATFFFDVSPLLPMFIAISVMLCVGVADDVSSLSPWLRFVIEIVMVLMMMFVTNMSLNNLHGLWGYWDLPNWISIPLTVVAVVGMVNAINLIDGVDGLSSGFCILASIAFGILFFKAGDITMLLLCLFTIGALLPFFFHNVFGVKTKMFIGDGGSLMMGVVMSSYVVTAISSGNICGQFYAGSELGLVPFTLAVMCAPVFDTVRVMTMRILRRTSPFHPDKTHLHHLFIELGFSHVGTTASVLSLNLIVVLLWYITYKCGASISTQFYVVMLSGILATAGFYKFMRIQIVRKSAIYHFARRIGHKTHIAEKKGWLALQKLVDFR